MGFSCVQKWMVALWLAAAFAIATFSMPHYWGRVPFDFRIRVNEVRQLVKGTDPFDIWSGKVASETCYPLYKTELETERRCNPIHAYTPWSYVVMLPFSGDMPFTLKWHVWAAVLIACFAVVPVFAFWTGWCMRRNAWDGLFVTAAALSISVVWGPGMGSGNYSIMLAAMLALMVVCLELHFDVLAGVCYAFIMIKPQDGALLSIPLLFARRWKTVLSAAAVCIAAATVSSALCGKSPIELILEVPKLGSPFYEGSILVPGSLKAALENAGVPHDAILLGNQFAGIALCCAMSWCVRRSNDWIVRLSPAVACAMAWTYMLGGDRCIFFLLQILFARECLAADGMKRKLFFGGMIFLVSLNGSSILTTCSDLFAAIGGRIGYADLYSDVRNVICVVEPVAGLALLSIMAVMCFRTARSSGYAGSRRP